MVLFTLVSGTEVKDSEKENNVLLMAPFMLGIERMIYTTGRGSYRMRMVLHMMETEKTVKLMEKEPISTPANENTLVDG